MDEKIAQRVREILLQWELHRLDAENPTDAQLGQQKNDATALIDAQAHLVGLGGALRNIGHPPLPKRKNR